MPGGGNLVRYERYRKGPRTPRTAHARYYYTRSLVLDTPIKKRCHAAPQRTRCQSAPKVMENHSRSASPRERPQHRPPSPPSSPGAFDNRAYQPDDADQNHNDSFTSSAPQNGHSKEPNGDTKLPEAVNLELINLTPKNGTKKKDVEVDINASNPYDEYFVPVNEHRKFMRGEKLYVTADKRGEKSGCKRPLCWTLLVLVVAAIIAIIVLAATGILFSSSPTPLDEYNSTVSSARAFGIGGSDVHAHDHHDHKDHDHQDHDHDHDHPDHGEPTAVPEPQNDQPNDHVPVSEENDTSMYVPRTLEGKLKIDNEEFTPALEDPDSAGYREFVNVFTDGIKKALFDKNTLENGDHDVIVEVVSLKQGSVIVTYRVHWKPKSNTEATQDILSSESLQTKLDNYLTDNNRMINVFHVAEDKMIDAAKPVLDMCQIDNNHCEYGCEFDVTTLEFTCTCPSGHILDMANPKMCVSILENHFSPNESTEDKLNNTGMVETTTGAVKMITEITHTISNANNFDWKPANEAPRETTTETDLNFSHIFSNQEHSGSPEPTPEPKSEPEPEPTSEPTFISKSETELTVESEPKAEPEPTAEPRAEPEPTAEPKPEPEPTAEPKPEPEPKAEPEPTPEPKAEPEPNAEPQPTTQTHPVVVVTSQVPTAEPDLDHSSSSESEHMSIDFVPSATMEAVMEPSTEPNLPNLSSIDSETTKNVTAESFNQMMDEINHHTSYSIEVATSSPISSEYEDDKTIKSEDHNMETTSIRVSISEPHIINEPSYEPKPEIISILSENKENAPRFVTVEDSEITTEHNEWLQDTHSGLEELMNSDIKNINNDSEQRSLKSIDAEEETTKKTGEEDAILITTIESTENNEKAPEEVTTLSTPENSKENVETILKTINMEENGTENPTATTTESNKLYSLSDQSPENIKEEKNIVEALNGATDTVTTNVNTVTTEKGSHEENLDITFDTINNMLYNRSSKSIENKTESDPSIHIPMLVATTTESDWLSEPVVEMKYQGTMNNMEKQETTEANAARLDEMLHSGVTKDDFEPDYLNNMGSNSKLSEVPMYGITTDYDNEDPRVKRVNKDKEASTKSETELTSAIPVETTTIIQYIYKTAEKMNESESNDMHVISLTKSNEQSDPAPVWEDSEKDLTVKELPNEKTNSNEEITLTTTLSITSTTMAPMTNSPTNEPMSPSSPASESSMVLLESIPVTSKASLVESLSEAPLNGSESSSASESPTTEASPTSAESSPPSPTEPLTSASTASITESSSTESSTPVIVSASVIPETVSTSSEAPATTSSLPEVLKSSDSELQSNTTQASNLNVTIYEISSHNVNNSFVHTHSGEYEDEHHHETEMNPFLPEVENNKSLVKKLQEGHDIEPTTFNETQNENAEDHSNTTETHVIINAVTKDDENKPTTERTSEMLRTNSFNNSTENVETVTQPGVSEVTTVENKEAKTVSTFLLDTDDLDKKRTQTMEIPATLPPSDDDSDYLSVVPIKEERLEEKQALKDFESENDISDSPKKSDRRTLDETKFDSVNNA